MKLISMTSFVLEIENMVKQTESEMSKDLFRLAQYAKFIDTPLKLENFIVCDEEGNVLEEPKRWKDYLQYPDSFDGNKEWDELYDYQQAKEKVLFEGIEFITNGGVNFLTIKEDTFAFFDFNIKFKNLTIEDLIQYNLQLTETAVKQIGL